MNKDKINKLDSALVSVRDNLLQLCDIYYDSLIKEVKPKTEKLFDWNDLKELSNRDKILSAFSDCISEDKFLLAVPGGVDSHVHFNTPGYEFREDFSHGSLAALYGGTTTIIDMPCTSIPPITSLENLKQKINVISGQSYVDYMFWGGIAGNSFDEKKINENIENLSKNGVSGFKVYMISGMDSFADLNEEQLEVVARMIARTGKSMAVHAEDKEKVESREKRFKSINRNDWQAYCESRDINAEISAVYKLIRISEKTKCKIHIVHLSSHLALQAIKDAQKKGIQITTETCPHYLYFTQKDFEVDSIRNYLKTAPPIKFEEDKESLWKGLDDGSVLFVTTDHAGCNPLIEKTSDNFWQVYGGIPGVEHRVPFMFSEGFLKGRLNLEKTVNVLSRNATNFFGIKNKGYIKDGYDADIVLIDLWNSDTVSSSKMHSKGKYTPFEGMRLNAAICKTLLRGNLLDLNSQRNDLVCNGDYVKYV